MSRPERNQDVVDEALEALRSASGPELPDPRIERRMVALATLAQERRANPAWPPLVRIAAGIALTTLWIYVAVYTPLKRRSAANTLVGAVSGALPPLIGWTAAGAPLNAGAISLFMILFVWQIPHFLAIAVLYRDDYARGGYRMLPVGEGGLERTAKTARRYSAFFIPVALLPSFVGLGGIAYGVGALLLSGWFLKVTMRFSSEPTRERARSLFLASIAVLPALLMLLCADAAVGR